MIRILIFIASAAFFAFVATALLAIDGRFVADAFGNRYDIHTGAALLLFVILVALAVGAILTLRSLARLPGAVRGAADEGRRIRGLDALTRGFEAIAVGDGDAAMREAKLAERKLSDNGLTRLLKAQASLLSGDASGAQEKFSAMLAAPETEFLGLRGLYLHAERTGDKEAAQGYAARAFALRPNAQWAFDSFLASGLDRGAWGEMRGALESARKSKAMGVEKARRGLAALLAADAAAASASGDQKLALQEAEKALKLAPDLTPAAILAARLQGAVKTSRGLKTLERAFESAPHGALIDAANDLLSGETPAARAQALERLAATAPNAPDAVTARAAARLALKDAVGATEMLQPLLRQRVSARLCALMAEAAIAAGGPDKETIAREWLKKASAAPREPDFSRGGVQFSRALWTRLIREFMETGRLTALTLDTGEEAGISEDELRRLSLPPPPADQPATDQESVAAASAAVESAAPKAGPAETAERAAKPKGPADLADAKLVGDRVSAARAIAAAGEVS